jgi:alpha-tubulin suppressor-like RCC1 family protein
MSRPLPLVAVTALILLGACDGCGGETPDAGDPPGADSGMEDAGDPPGADSGVEDSGTTTDAGATDASVVDDDGGSDGGSSDGGVADASLSCPSACASNAGCELVDGEPTCVCDEGFTGDGETCEDVDECQATASPCAMDDVCHNIPGGFFCECGPGEVWNGASCETVGQRRIGSGAEHVCRIDSQGAMKCWGMNHRGQVGDGTQDRRAEMTVVSGGHVWRSVSVFRNTTCAIDTDSRAWCWGEVGALQLGGTNPAVVPQQAGSFDDWEQLSIGDGHVCGIRQGGGLHCWGLNTQGQLGVEPPQNAAADAPIQVEPATSWATVSAGSSYTCGVKLDGTLWCWGSNQYSALGGGSSGWTPMQVGADADWRSVHAGPFFATCGLKLDGTLSCWGSNTYGQVGSSANPVTTPQEHTTAAGYRSVDMGSLSVCGTRFDGSIWCRGHAVGPVLAPVDADALAGLGAVVDVATSEPGAAGLAFPTFSCALAGDDSTWCWGQNNDGQLALGSFGNKSEPERVGAATWTHAEPGASYTCARRDDGTLWCWGSGNAVYWHLVAPGVAGIAQLPTLIDSDTDWLSLSAGAQAFCGIKTGQSLWCTGSRFTTDLEQVASSASWAAIDLGRGNYIDSRFLVAAAVRDDGSLWTFNEYTLPDGEQLGTDTDWDEVAIAREHACGRRGGTLWCWFEDTPDDPPVQVGTESDWTLVRSSPELAGASGTIAAASYGVRSDGTLWKWTMSAGQPIAPAQIGQGIDWESLDTGAGLLCGVATDKSLWCWGSVDLARLIATREFVAAPDPLRIGADNDWQQVRIGYQLVVALKTDGSMWSWGYGHGGELGHGDAWRVLPSLAR